MNLKEVANKIEKNKPKKDSSGKGLRLNKGRGGCITTKEKDQGMRLAKDALMLAGGVAVLGASMKFLGGVID